MLPGFQTRLYQERRRLTFVVGLAFFAGFFMYLRSDAYLFGLPIAWTTGAIYAVVVGICALVICLFLPSMRFMTEAVAVSRLILSLVLFAVPSLGAVVLSDPIVTAGVIVLGGMVVSRVMHGRILKESARTWRGRLMPQVRLQRVPVRLQASPWQRSYVGWMDGDRRMSA